jgi:hypothetical protein
MTTSTTTTTVALAERLFTLEEELALSGSSAAIGV